MEAKPEGQESGSLWDTPCGLFVWGYRAWSGLSLWRGVPLFHHLDRSTLCWQLLLPFAKARHLEATSDFC